MHVSIKFTSFLALLDFVSRATVVAQASVACASSVNCGFSETVHGSRPNFVESYLSIISSESFSFIQNFHFSNFYDFFFIFANMRPHWSKNFKTLLLPQFSSDLSETLNKVVIGEYKVINVLAIWQTIKTFWHFDILA